MPGEGEIREAACLILLTVGAVDRTGVTVRKSGPPRIAVADIATEVDIDRSGTDPVLVPVVAGKCRSATQLRARFEVEVGRCDPFQMQPVVAVLAAKERLIASGAS